MEKEDPKRKKVFDLEERLIQFAVRVLHVVDALPDTRAGRHIAGQLVRCGTSPAPNYGEAEDAESRDDVTLQPFEENFEEILEETRFRAGFFQEYVHNSVA